MARKTSKKPAAKVVDTTPEPEAPEPVEAPAPEADTALAETAQPAPAAPEPLEPATDIDETVPGGRYRVDGRLVDSEGKPIKGSR